LCAYDCSLAVQYTQLTAGQPCVVSVHGAKSIWQRRTPVYFNVQNHSVVNQQVPVVTRADARGRPPPPASLSSPEMRHAHARVASTHASLPHSGSLHVQRRMGRGFRLVGREGKGEKAGLICKGRSDRLCSVKRECDAAAILYCAVYFVYLFFFVFYCALCCVFYCLLPSGVLNK